MSDPDPVDPPTPAHSESEARSRRRWLTLAEVLGILALVISAATLWNNVAMRKSQEAARVAEEAKQALQSREAEHEAALVSLVGEPQHGGSVLTLTDQAGHSIQSADIRFPPALGVATKQTLIDPQIDADWFADRLLDMTDGGPDAVQGRLPVEISARYWSGDQQRTDRAIYDVVFTTEGRIFAGRKLRLKGVVLRRRVSGDAGATLDSLWKAERKRLQSLKK